MKNITRPPVTPETAAKRKKTWKIIRSALIFIGVCFGVATSYYTFITPNHFAPGGVYGLGSMIQNMTKGQFGLKDGIPWAIPVIILSIPLIVGTALVLGKKQAFIVGGLAVTTNVIDIVLEAIHFPQLIGETDMQKVFAAALGGMLSGVVFAITIREFGTADGTIALASIVKKKRPQASIAWMTFAFDAVVVFASFFVYWNQYTQPVADREFNVKFMYALQPIMFSIINMFFVSKFCDIILKGIETAYKVEIITDEPDVLSEALLKEVQRGVTVMPAKGMYTGKEKWMVVCVVSKRQIGQIKKILRRYPTSFSYIVPANEVIGDYVR